MDITQQKPFACKSEGCGMSFTNEDHLNVHEKKHEMVLSLGLKGANVFVADQTPTPTRLIKNCEEVGLFEDLKHVNPFDETFRRAVEAKNIPNLTMPSNNSGLEISKDQESLHTPQVFPNLDESIQPMVKNFNLSTPNEIFIDNMSVKPTQATSKRKVESHQKSTRKLLPKESNLSQPQVISVTFPSTLVHPSKPIILPKMELKKQSASVPANFNLKATPTSQLPIKERLKAALHWKASASKEMKEKPISVERRTEQNNCMERRRAASCRYRNKIKKEHFELRKKNAQLSAENEHLKTVIRELKNTLSNHANCDVSRGKVTTPSVLPEIQIPSSTVHLVMKIPNLVINPGVGTAAPGSAILRID